MTAMTPPHIVHDLLKRRTLFVSDLDGTLLNRASLISSRSAEMLNMAISQGALFTVATARTPATAISLLSEVDMCLPGVVMTGAALFDFKQHAFSRLQYIAQGVASRLVDMYRQAGVCTFVYTFDGAKLVVYHVGELNELERGFISQRAHTRVKQFIVPPSGDSALPANLDNTVLLYSVQPWTAAKALYDNIVETRLPVNPLCYHDNYGPEWAQLEVFGNMADKALAVEAIASMVRADRIVAFGDNVNDMPLFDVADEGIAVANAIDELKARATDMIADNDSDAVASHILARISKA